MPLDDSEIQIIAKRILDVADAGQRMAPVTDTRADFSSADAERVGARIALDRAARGEQPVGWKIGFTNHTIWDEYGVHAPIWGPMYATTLAAIPDATTPYAWRLGQLVQPRIEPEIMFRLRAAPTPDMDERALLETIDAVAHGFEIVQSVFPDWKFKAPDTIAAFALHGAYRHGPLTLIEDRNDWLERLTRFEIELTRDGLAMDRGAAVNVLDGPLSALRHFVRGLAHDPLGRKLGGGDLVTTGTVTRAFPVRAGELWETQVIGLPLPGLKVQFA